MLAATTQGAKKYFFCDECFTDPQTGVASGVTQSRNVRSRYRCSMCPAIHINSRSWLRPSSTHEPSDPPPRVFFFSFMVQSRRWQQKIRRISLRLMEGSITTWFGYGSSNEMPYALGKKKHLGIWGRGSQSSFKLALSPCLRGCWGTPRKPRRSSVLPWYEEKFERHADRPSLARSVVYAARDPQSPENRRDFVFFAFWYVFGLPSFAVMILPQVHLRKPCYDFYFL